MPRAGTDRGARRYHDEGNTHKATAHFGRMLEYDRAAKFGTGPLVEIAAQITLPTVAALGAAVLGTGVVVLAEHGPYRRVCIRGTGRRRSRGDHART
jgi:hypothetical protein